MCVCVSYTGLKKRTSEDYILWKYFYCNTNTLL